MADDYSQFFRGEQVPESVRAQIMAAQLLQQSAAQAERPYTSKGVVALKALSGLLGGLQQSSAIQGEQAAQAAHRTALASLLAQPQAGSPGATGGAGPGTVGMAGAPAAGTPISSSGNPAGYDPKATEALIRSRAPAYGINPDTAVAVARSEGLNSYTGDNGSSHGPFQLHYGNVAGGGNAVGGLGDTFTAQTKLDARDPSTVPQQVDFALQNAAQNGWGAWHGAKNSGIGNFEGIGQTPPSGRTAQADMPAPNAIPTGSDTLPPGVTADMIGGSSPYGGPPKPMANIVTAAMAKAGMDTTGLPGAVAPNPFGALRPMSRPPAPAPTAPAPAGASSSPFGGPPQPIGQQQLSPQQSAAMASLLAAPQPDPSAPQPDPSTAPDQSDTSASPQVAMSSGADPALMTDKPVSGSTPIMPDGSAGPSPLLSGQADPGASTMLPASPPLPPPNPQSPFGGAPQPMTPPPAVPPAAMAAALRGGQPPMSAAPLSTDNLPGMDNFSAAGGVQQSSLGASGFTGRDNAPDPVTAATQGGLPGPQAYVGGDMGLGTLSAPAAPSVAAAEPSAAPTGPLPQMAAGNLPAPNMSPLATALAQGAPPAPAPPPQAGLASSPQPAPALNPDAPAPGAIPAGPAPLPPAALADALRQGAPQPMGLSSGNAADPSSAQNFNRQAMSQALLQGAPGAATPAGGGQQNPQASAGGQQGGSAASTPSMAPQPSGGGFLSGLFGGSQPQRAPMPAGMSPQQQQIYGLLQDPRTSPQEAEMLLNRLNPAPIPVKQGDGLLMRNPDGTYRNVYTQPALDKYKVAADGSILDSSKGSTSIDPNAYQVTEIDAGNGVKLHMAVARNPDGSFRTQLLTPNGAGPGSAPGAATPPQPVAPITFGGPSTSSAAPGGPLTVNPPASGGTTSPLGPQVQSFVDAAGAQQTKLAGAKAAAEANAKNDVDEVAASRTKLESLRQSGQDLAQAQAALDAYKGKMPTGPFGQNALWAQGVANTVGLGDPNQLSNMEIFAKNATKVASAQIKEFTSKGTNLDLETELKNNPGVNVSDQTNRILIDHMGKANAVLQQYEQAKQSYYDQNGSLKGFQPQWEQSISGAAAIPLSSYPVDTKTASGQTYQKFLSTDPSGYTWRPLTVRK